MFIRKESSCTCKLYLDVNKTLFEISHFFYKMKTKSDFDDDIHR